MGVFASGIFFPQHLHIIPLGELPVLPIPLSRPMQIELRPIRHDHHPGCRFLSVLHAAASGKKKWGEQNQTQQEEAGIGEHDVSYAEKMNGCKV